MEHTKRQIQERESELLARIDRDLLAKVNAYLRLAHRELRQRQTACLGQKDWKTCLQSQNRLYAKKADTVDAFLEHYERYFTECTGMCRYNYNMQIAECYLDCIEQTGKLLDRVGEEIRAPDPEFKYIE